MSDQTRHFDRFRLESLTDYQRMIRVETGYLDPRIAKLLIGSAANTDSLTELSAAEPCIPLRVHLEVSTCAGVARTLLDLDVELRRTAEFLTSGGTRPAGNSHVIEVASAVRSTSIDVVLACGGGICSLLTSQPLAFLQTLDWFWLNRHTRMRVRIPSEVIDPTPAWSTMLHSARVLSQRGDPVALVIEVAADGLTTFGFAPVPGSEPGKNGRWPSLSDL